MTKKNQLTNIASVAIGSILFAIGCNLFTVPMGVYNGGVIGIAQIIRTILVENFNLQLNFDIAGVINFLLNLPLFILAFKSISRRFFFLTLFGIAVQTIAFSMIPIPAIPILNDPLTSMIIGGLVGGYGIGLCLKAGGCGGGTDIVGVYFSLRYKAFSVGKLSIIINAIIYSYCAIAFSLSTAIYSIIYAVVFGIAVDKVHVQNIAVETLVITKNKEVKKKILYDLGRGVTYWEGKGAYTEEDTDIFVTMISKYEVNQMKRMVLSLDPNAFIIMKEGSQVTGNYEKRLL